MRVKGLILLGAIIAMGTPVKQAGAADGTGRAPLQVQVDVGATLGSADLEPLRGVCEFSFPSEPDDPMYKAWIRAGFTYPRWPWLGYVEVSWQQNDDGSRAMILDFDTLDRVLADCKEMRVEPLFLVGGTPAALSSKSDPDIRDDDHPAHYAPADYTQWEEYVFRTVRRAVEKGYRGYHYEVLNEPEDYVSYWRGKPGSTNADTLADYVELYRHTARAIKAADPSAKVGGPVCAHWDSVTASMGTHAWGLPEFIRALARYRKEHPEEDVPLDFVDWHDYSFISPRLSDGIDFVDKVLAEVDWPGRPDYLITEWNIGLSKEEDSLLRRASHAAWNIIREADPSTRRVARLYWYVLDGGGNDALVQEPAASPSAKDSSAPTYGLSPAFAVFEILGRMNHGGYLRVNAEEPLVALATGDGEAARLMISNNTPESRTASIELSDLPTRLRNGICHVQLVDSEHSADGHGLEAGQEVPWQPAEALALELTPYATALVTISAK